MEVGRTQLAAFLSFVLHLAFSLFHFAFCIAFCILDRFFGLTSARLLRIVPPTMTTIIRLFLCGLALAVPPWAVLRAAEPGARTTGRVLILKNERVLEGDVRRVGDDYCIRRAVGEVWVPAEKVLCLCASWEEAYAQLKTQANLGDPDERLRLARWCQLHALRKEALAEVTAALQLRPNHAESRNLQNLLKRRVAAAAVPANPPRPEPGSPANPLPPVDLNTDSLSAFTTRVQPILMNACARCHTGNRGGQFRLLRCYQGGGVNQRATQQNLAAVMAQINVHRPQVSPLLIKAVCSHSGTTGPAPLKGRQSPAFRALQEWVTQTLADNPQLVEEPAGASTKSAAAPAAAQEPTRPDVASDNVAEFRSAVAVHPGATAGAPVVALTGAKTSPAARGAGPAASKTVLATKAPPVQPARTNPKPPTPEPAAPADPFDPVIFNRQMHPDKE
jgi:hypothetical protein